jgi:hypothetical protein
VKEEALTPAAAELSSLPVSKDQLRSPQSAKTQQSLADQAARRGREAAALRANLKKRKEQARARGERKDSADQV